jgi:hypothetical protein
MSQSQVAIDEKINQFIYNSSAFIDNISDENILQMKENIKNKGWKIYKFPVRKEKQMGYEFDIKTSENYLEELKEYEKLYKTKEDLDKFKIHSNNNILAMYCWYDTEEYCVTDEKYIISAAKIFYNNKPYTCVFSIC